MLVKPRIGFMQGRLSPKVDGKIQAFPWDHWKSEFPAAQRLGFSLMEWTLDQQDLYKNPLMNAEGRKEIKTLCAAHGIQIPSLTGDCFMQAPFYKATPEARASLLKDLRAIAEACVDVGIKFIVVPLVDAGRLENEEQTRILKEGLFDLIPYLRSTGLRVLFESDLGPQDLKRFMEGFPVAHFGINYDIGNSASLGHDPRAELGAYFDRILNVHVKDRVLGGTTVPLGTGNADFRAVFSALKERGYSGYYILQTARASDDDHAGVLRRYRDFTAAGLGEAS